MIQIISEKQTYRLLSQSLKLGGWVVLGTLVISFPLALITTKTKLRNYGWLDILFTLPFMTPPYIGAMGWILFMQKNGFLMQLFPKLSGLSAPFFSLFGMVMIMSLHLFPTFYLMLKNSMLTLEGSFQEAAKIYGKNSLFNWVRISLPLLIPSFLLGALFIFVKTLAEFGTPVTFGTRIGYNVFTTEIHTNLASWPVNIPKATFLSLVLFVLCFVLWLIQVKVIQRFVYGTVSGATKELTVTTNKWVHAVSIVFVILLFLLAIGIPYFSILMTSLMTVRGDGLVFSNLSLAAYRQLFTNQNGGFSAFLNSFLFAACTGVITATLGFFAGIYIYKGTRYSQKVVDFFGLIPNIVPGIVLVVGLMLFWNTSWLPVSFYNTKAMAVITYCTLFLPYAIQYVKNNMLQLNESIFEATDVFSRTKLGAFTHIYFPLLKRGVLTGMMMTFIISMRELVGSLLILPPSVETSATFIYRQFEQGNVNTGMAMAVVTIIITCIFVIAIEKSKK
jgi:iron(III) transport system permease protein